MAALPNDVMARARHVVTKLSELEEKGEVHFARTLLISVEGRNLSLAQAVAIRRKNLLEVKAVDDCL